jgi:hypothetical protein
MCALWFDFGGMTAFDAVLPQVITNGRSPLGP